ncbi:MAG: fibronectin type III domain-containing protein, partial [Verrucomicrobia bacterium]|nr:fibronectin type III domain-containing protein [Verrucomicrobiota bacterium]
MTLHWNASPYPVTDQTVSRRRAGTTGWEFTTALAPTALAWNDSSAANQTLYEYRVERVHSSPLGAVAEGWIWAGSEIPAVEDRGRIILAVDATMAVPLGPELHRLTTDLAGDGWEVVTTEISRNATPIQTRDAIRGWYVLDPARTRAVLLLGRIPVPYSGQVCPDGHWDPPPRAHHRGAWPADAFYGDMDGVWTDSSVNYSLANVDGTRNHNVPGDGK